MKKIYEFDFAEDDGNWDLISATITGGVLDCEEWGLGQRSPDADWLSGANDDFIFEVDFKQDATAGNVMYIFLELVGDATEIEFYLSGNTDTMRIYYAGEKASQAFVDDTAWHTSKIRRVGTTYYWSIDGGSEISWDYGTPRAIESIMLTMFVTTGDFDNFKYSFMNIPFAIGVGNPMIL